MHIGYRTASLDASYQPPTQCDNPKRLQRAPSGLWWAGHPCVRPTASNHPQFTEEETGPRAASGRLKGDRKATGELGSMGSKPLPAGPQAPKSLLHPLAGFRAQL